MENNNEINKENKQDTDNLKQYFRSKDIKLQEIKRMVKYSFELKKIGIIDSLRQSIAGELANDLEITEELIKIINILNYYLKNKETEKFSELFEEWLKSLFLESEGGYKEYRNNLLNINLLDTLETKIKTGEVNVNKVRQIIKRYDGK